MTYEAIRSLEEFGWKDLSLEDLEALSSNPHEKTIITIAMKTMAKLRDSQALTESRIRDRVMLLNSW